MGKVIKYEHHNIEVAVDGELKGKHREHCLCFKCQRFNPDVPDQNCRIAEMLFRFCRLNGMTTPVYECPEFIESNEAFKPYHNYLLNR